VCGPAPLPLLWFGLYRAPQVWEHLPAGGAYTLGEWRPSQEIDGYRRAIAQIKQAIARGDTYQVNYTIALHAAWRGDPWGLFVDLANAQRGGYAAFAAAALAERSAAGLPPFGHQVLWRAEAARPEPPSGFLEAVAAMVRGDAPAAVEVWGPVPAPMERRAGRYRAHLLLQATERAVLHSRLGAWIERAGTLPAARRTRWAVDVDPQDTL
jgi:hypothetical protein